MTELGRAGFKPQAILDSTEAVLALARSTSTELPRASEIAGAAMRAFNLPATEMVRVSDVLTATANKSAQTLDDLAEALKPVSPIAVEAGASLEDTAAAIGILANNGIKGSLAGNALARAVLADPQVFIMDEAINSGVQFRSRQQAEDARVSGYQCELDHSDRRWTGGIYDEGGVGWRRGHAERLLLGLAPAWLAMLAFSLTHAVLLEAYTAALVSLLIAASMRGCGGTIGPSGD